MKNNELRLSRLLSVILAFVILTGFTPIRPEDLPFPRIEEYQAVNSEGQWFREVSSQSLGIDFYQNVAMSGFELGFGENNDHQISVIGVEPESMPASGRVHFTYHENDKDDYFRPYYSFLSFDSDQSRVFTTSRICEGVCTVRIAPRHNYEVMVLSGFKFDLINERSNLRKLSIRPQNRGFVDVEFSDNGSKRYRVTLHYLFIHESLVSGSDSLSLARRQDSHQRTIREQREPGLSLLRGFSFEFLNGDHRIGELSIISSQSGTRYDVKFNDQNTDDPYHVEIDYITLRSDR